MELGEDRWDVMPELRTRSGCWPVRKDCCVSVNQAQESCGKRRLRSLSYGGQSLAPSKRMQGKLGWVQLHSKLVPAPGFWGLLFEDVGKDIQEHSSDCTEFN